MKTIFSLAICAMAVLFTSCGNSAKAAKAFSVAEGKQVIFSLGNLQYNPANNLWRFAESQTDYIGEANSNISSTHDGWIDLFGWSTSATNFGVSTSTDEDDYSGSFSDWGRNQIGDDAPNTWRTLSIEEWVYLLARRANADSLIALGVVNGVCGLILLPDHWKCPNNVTFEYGFHSDYEYQIFTADQWSKLEKSGAVFLPASGLRYGHNVRYANSIGAYWSATPYGGYNEAALIVVSDDDSNKIVEVDNRNYGCSVRLVKDL